MSEVVIRHDYEVGEVEPLPEEDREYDEETGESVAHDFRTDFTALGPVKHQDPLLVDVEYRRRVFWGETNVGWFYPEYTAGHSYKVSMELWSHLAVSNIASPLSDPVTQAERFHMKSNLHSVNLNRYLNISADDITGDTVKVAYGMWRAKRQARQEVGLPFPVAPV
jgi:hypothetical protein